MSRIGKKPIPRSGVRVHLEQNVIQIEGPKGILSREIPSHLDIRISDSEIQVSRKEDTKFSRSLHGTYRQLIANMVEGVTKGHRKELLIVGTGYRAKKEDRTLILQIGYSEPKKVDIPSELNVEVENNVRIHISGKDKQLVGDFAAEIRRIKPPDSYKGKGIRYANEIVRLKPGKAGVKAKGPV